MLGTCPDSTTGLPHASPKPSCCPRTLLPAPARGKEGHGEGLCHGTASALPEVLCKPHAVTRLWQIQARLPPHAPPETAPWGPHCGGGAGGT